MRCAIFLNLSLAVLALPAVFALPAADPLERRVPNDLPYIVDSSCRARYKKHPQIERYDRMLHAVKEARTLARTAVTEWWDEGKHGEIAAQYLAIPDDGRYKDNEYAQRVKENLLNVARVTESGTMFSRTINIICDDRFNKCNLNVEGTRKPIAAYAENGGNAFTGYTYHINVCETWFLTQTIHAAWEEFKNDPKEKVAMEWLENDAAKMLHELMHINMVTQSRPHIVDVQWNGARAYTAPRIHEWVANGAKTSDVVQNADSYTQFVNAIHFKNRFGYLPPPVREVPIEQIQDCWTDGNRYVDKSQSKHIADFCENKVAGEYTPGSYGSITNSFNAGTADHVDFRFFRRREGKFGINTVKEQCIDSMHKLFNSCDQSSNWKHGGILVHKQGNTELYEYQVLPKHDRPNPVPSQPAARCDVWYKFFYNEFFIYGGLFAGNDHGQSKLLPNLRRCGIVSEWKFDYYGESDDKNYEWKAYGRLPIGAQQWGCVRRAIIDAGGPADMGGCGGR